MMPLFFLEIGIYFGQPRGFGTNENGEEIGFNTEVYAAYEVVFRLLLNLLSIFLMLAIHDFERDIVFRVILHKSNFSLHVHSMKSTNYHFILFIQIPTTIPEPSL